MSVSTPGSGRSAHRSSVSTADEIPVPGPVPLWEVPGWRDRFGVVAGITGRGPDPENPFDLGLWTSQPVGAVMGRWRRLRAVLPEFAAAVLAHQVHQDNVLWHDQLAAGWTLIEGADGHATRTAGSLLFITVADCVPIYLIAPREGAIALIHAGWRGTACGILSRAVGMLKTHASAHSHDVVMHCGVAISGAQYEVGNEVLATLGRTPDASGHSQLDLRSVLTEQAERLGIGEVTSSTFCTASRRDLFFSHRGSGGSDGRMVAYLGIPERGSRG